MVKSLRKKNSNQDDSKSIEDDRFSNLVGAPIFKKSSKSKNKVVLDDRFKSVLTDERFRVTPGNSVDSYGRKKKKVVGEDRALKELQNFYEVEKAEVEEEQEVSQPEKKKKTKDSSTKGDYADRLDYLTKLARGEISGSSDDESDEESESYEVDSASGDSSDDYDEDDDAEGLSNKKSPLDIAGEEEMEYGEATKRISVLNCDWESIKAEDLMVMLQSFCPPGKQVLRVTVYPSDFGKQRMAEELKYGPQRIWIKQDTKKRNTSAGSSVDSFGDEDDEEIDENEDLYDNIEDYEDEEGAENNDEDDDEVIEEDEQEEESDNDAEAKKTGKKDGDFQRKGGAVGIVLHDDMVRRRTKAGHKDDSDGSDNEDDEGDDEDQSMSDDSSTVSDKRNKRTKSKKEQTDIDEVALREYELSKLRYYFAIAECDSLETANILYEELDDVELQDSAMALELRFVPDDLDLSAREVRDTSTGISHNYKPPEHFSIDALQHTKVKCTWDEGDKDRERKLTNVSSWRSLRDSELMQYIASSDSEDEDMEMDEPMEEEMEEGSFGRSARGSARGSVGKGSISSIRSVKKTRAKKLRKLLLGGAASSDEEDVKEKDDFFQAAEDENNASDDDDSGVIDIPKKKSKSKDTKESKKKSKKAGVNVLDDLKESDEMVMSYVPEEEQELKEKLSKKKKSGSHNTKDSSDLTPLELELQKSAAIKKEKKEAKRQYHEMKTQEAKAIAHLTKQQLKTDHLLALDADETADGEGDRIVTNLRPWEAERERHKDNVEKKKVKNKFKKGKGRYEEDTAPDTAEGTTGENVALAQTKNSTFQIDVTDTRFQKVFGGDASFGIDTTSHDYKATTGMQTILETQRKVHAKQQKKTASATPAATSSAMEESGNQVVEVDSLVNRLKRKFQ